MGLIFLKYISDSFEEHFAKLEAGEGDYAGADPEDKDEYSAENIFFVRKKRVGRFCCLTPEAPTLEPYKVCVFDPCCSSVGMFVQSEKFIEDHQGKINDISIYEEDDLDFK